MTDHVALHEAGHLVIAHLLGHTLLRATVVRAHGKAGEMFHATPASTPDDARNRQTIVIALAARAATDAYPTDASCFEPDDTDAWRCARLIVGDDPALAPRVGRLVAACWVEAQDLAADHRQAITDVARRLELLQTIEGEALNRFVAEAVAADRASPYRQQFRDSRHAAAEWLRTHQEGAPDEHHHDDQGHRAG